MALRRAGKSLGPILTEREVSPPPADEMKEESSTVPLFVETRTVSSTPYHSPLRRLFMPPLKTTVCWAPTHFPLSSRNSARSESVMVVMGILPLVHHRCRAGAAYHRRASRTIRGRKEKARARTLGHCGLCAAESAATSSLGLRAGTGDD